jgi:hypothetical protein
MSKTHRETLIDVIVNLSDLELLVRSHKDDYEGASMDPEVTSSLDEIIDTIRTYKEQTLTDFSIRELLDRKEKK